MESNEHPFITGGTAGTFGLHQASYNVAQNDRGGGFLENWDVDASDLALLQDADHVIIGEERGWHWGSFEHCNVEKQMIHKADTSSRAQAAASSLPTTAGGVSPVSARQHLPLPFSKHHLNSAEPVFEPVVEPVVESVVEPFFEPFVEPVVAATAASQAELRQSALGCVQRVSNPSASNQTVRAEISPRSGYHNASDPTPGGRQPDKLVQTDLQSANEDVHKAHNDGRGYLGSASGLAGSVALFKGFPKSGISRLRVPWDWTPPKFPKLPPRLTKRKRSAATVSSVRSPAQSTKRPRTTSHTAYMRRITTNTDQPRCTGQVVILPSTKTSNASERDSTVSHPRQAPVVARPNHTSSTVTVLNSPTLKLPTVESAASVKRLHAAAQPPTSASHPKSKQPRSHGSSRNRIGAALNSSEFSRPACTVPARPGHGQTASTGFTVSDVIVLSEDEEVALAPEKPTLSLKKQPALPMNHRNRQESWSAKQPSQALKDHPSRLLTENGQHQITSMQQLLLPRVSTAPFQQSSAAITTHIGPKGTSKPKDLVSFRGSRPIKLPEIPMSQPYPCETPTLSMGKTAAVMVLKRTAAPKQKSNDALSQFGKARQVVKRLSSCRTEQSWYESRDKETIYDERKSQKRQDKFRQEIKNSSPNLPEEEVKKRVDAKEEAKRSELFRKREIRALKKAHEDRLGELELNNSTDLEEELNMIRQLPRPTRPLYGLGPARLVIAYRVLMTHLYVNHEEAEDQYIEVRTFLDKHEANDHARAIFLNQNDPALLEAGGDGKQLKEMKMALDDERGGLFAGERTFMDGKRHSVIVDYVQMQVGEIKPRMHTGKKLSKQAKGAFTPVQYIVWAVFTIDQSARRCDSPSRLPSSMPPNREATSLLAADNMTKSQRKLLSSIVSPLPKSLYSDYFADQEEQAAEEMVQDEEANSGPRLGEIAERGKDHESDGDFNSEIIDHGTPARMLNDNLVAMEEPDAKKSHIPTRQPDHRAYCHISKDKPGRDRNESGDEDKDEEEDDQDTDSFKSGTECVNYYHEMITSFTTLRAANIEAYRVFLRMQSLISLNGCTHPTCTCRQGGLSEFLRQNEVNPIAEAVKNDIDLSRPHIEYNFNNDPAYRLPLGFRHLQIFVKKTELIGPVPVGEGLIDNTEELEEEVIEEREDKERLQRRQEAREKEAQKARERRLQKAELRQREKALGQEVLAPQRQGSSWQAKQREGDADEIEAQEEQQRMPEQHVGDSEASQEEDLNISEEE